MFSKRIAAVLACVALMSGAAAAAGAWKSFSNKDFGVYGTVPDTPDFKAVTSLQKTRFGPTRVLTVTANPSEAESYVLEVDAYQNGIKGDPVAFLNGAVDRIGNLKANRATTVTRVPTTVDGYAAIDYTLGPTAYGSYWRGRLIAKDNMLVQMLVVASEPPPLNAFFTDLTFRDQGGL